MPTQLMSLALVGFVVTALGHFTLAMYLTRAGYLARGAGRPQSLAVLAVLATAAWGLSGVADQLSRFTGPSYVVAGVDLLRYGLWMAVLLALLKPKTTNDVPPDSRSGPNLVGPAAALLVLAVGALAWRLATKQYESDASRLWSAVFLALPVFGLVLVEQLFRNLPADSRWAAKPVCMGLAALFAFDVYVFAEAVLLGRVDPDARDIRPMVHLVAVPFLWIAARRRTDWSRSLQVSRRAAFYSATLLLAGGYLLFISAVGYYVRYFGGDWGRALQLGLVNLIDDDPLGAARALAQDLARQPRAAVRAAKALLRREGDSLPERIDLEAKLFAEALSTPEFQARAMAVLSKGAG